MLHRIVLPQLGQTMDEGTIERWHKQEGDAVEKGEILYELTTDKATLEVESFASGIVRKILAAEGQTLPVNELIAVIGDPEDELPDDLTAARPAPAASQESSAPTPAGAAPAPTASVAPTVAVGAPTGRVFVSPRARKIGEELHVPVAALRGSGPGGRVVERDVQAYVDALRGIKHTPAAAAYACEQGVSLVEVASGLDGGRITREDVEEAVESGRVRPGSARVAEQRVDLSPMRRTIAERMTAAKQAIPHFYLVGDVLMRKARGLLAEISAEGTKVTVTGLLIKAVGLALKAHPRVNCRFDGNAVVLNPRCNVGVAVAVDDGLFVPVVNDADRKTLPAISGELRALAGQAREGTLIPEQYEGGSITLSNLGMYGVDYFLPIINMPQSCIIGVGKMSDQVLAYDGGIRVEPVMKLSLSADHRAIDGAQCAEFFQTLKGLLEEPERIGR
jgi:pyruvate dehydrogenase E2 component (dihydrolipoamide acetyltransferase)